MHLTQGVGVGEKELTEVRKAAAAAREAAEELKNRIIMARESGEKIQAIADAAGLTKQRVWQIVKEFADQSAALGLNKESEELLRPRRERGSDA
jgi:hypothetical protein